MLDAEKRGLAVGIDGMHIACPPRYEPVGERAVAIPARELRDPGTGTRCRSSLKGVLSAVTRSPLSCGASAGGVSPRRRDSSALSRPLKVLPDMHAPATIASAIHPGQPRDAMGVEGRASARTGDNLTLR
jgi:hypothetical protein